MGAASRLPHSGRPGLFPRAASVNLSAHWFGPGRCRSPGHPRTRRLRARSRTSMPGADRTHPDRQPRGGAGTGCAGCTASAPGSRWTISAPDRRRSPICKHFHFDTIKMDRAFVAPLGQDTRAETVARTVLRMGHGPWRYHLRRGRRDFRAAGLPEVRGLRSGTGLSARKACAGCADGSAGYGLAEVSAFLF